MADIVGVMKTRKSKAAKKHLDDRIGPWSRRYSFGTPQGYEVGVSEFCRKQGGGSGGVGVVKNFALKIYSELL